MSTKTKSQKTFALIFVGVIALAVVGYSFYSTQDVKGWNWTWGGTNNTPTPTPINNPTPTLTEPPTSTPSPTSTSNPTSTPIVYHPTAQIWQTLYVTNQDNSHYQVSAPNKIQSQSVIGWNGQNQALVTKIQNDIYINADLKGLQTSSYSLTCTETITIQDSNHHVLGTVASSSVSGSGLSLVSGQDTWVLGAPLTSSGLVNIISQYHTLTTTPLTYYFVVTLSNITIHFYFTNGQSGTLTALPDNTNILSWQIAVYTP